MMHPAKNHNVRYFVMINLRILTIFKDVDKIEQLFGISPKKNLANDVSFENS